MTDNAPTADSGSSKLTIRPYRDEDESDWMRVHAIILSISHSWNYTIQERPTYAGHESTKIVAELDGRIVGLSDTQYERAPGEFCFLKDSPGGYVLEFGRLPEYGGLEVGERLIESTVEDARLKGFHRLEYWSQDRRAQRYYARRGMPEIGRHYRFHFRPPEKLGSALLEDGIGVEHLHAMCLPEDWPIVKKKYEIIDEHPLEPHLCIGYEIRF